MVLGSMLVHCLALSPCSKGFKSSGWLGALCVHACVLSWYSRFLLRHACWIYLFFFLLAIGVNVRVNE